MSRSLRCRKVPWADQRSPERTTADSTASSVAPAAAAGLCAVLSLFFIGIALMLWAATPEGDVRSFGVLLGVPVVMIVLTVGAALFAKRGAPASAFDDLRKQFSADLRMLREVKKSR